MAEAALHKLAAALKQSGTNPKVASLQLLGELGLSDVQHESSTLSTITESIHVLGQILPKLRNLSMAQPRDPLSMQSMDFLSAVLDAARIVIKYPQDDAPQTMPPMPQMPQTRPQTMPQTMPQTRDTGDACAHWTRTLFVLDTIAEATHAVIQILLRIQSLPKTPMDTTSKQLLVGLGAMMEDICVLIERRRERVVKCSWGVPGDAADALSSGTGKAPAQSDKAPSKAQDISNMSSDEDDD